MKAKFNFPFGKKSQPDKMIYPDREYIAIDRDKLLFSGARNMATLRKMANCKCIAHNVKAVIEGNPSAAEFIVMSVHKINALVASERDAVFKLLENSGAVRKDINKFSSEISIRERLRRNLFLSRFEEDGKVA